MMIDDYTNFAFKFAMNVFRKLSHKLKLKSFFFYENMTREEKILHKVNKENLGLEIGPSYNPIASKRTGFNVHTIDHLDQAGLKAKYENVSSVDISRIEVVDFIWDGRSYAELTGKRYGYDWVIASHVIEHTPDIVSFLIQCEEVLVDDGILSLAVPDLRFCFDHFRPMSSISEVIDAYLQKRTIHSPGSIYDHCANIVSRDGKVTWLEGTRGVNKCLHDRSYAKTVMSSVVEDNKYVDTHAWMFTPSSFRLMIDDLNYLGFINLKEDVFFPTAGHEFFMTLSRQGKGLQKSRIEMLEAIRSEYAQV